MCDREASFLGVHNQPSLKNADSYSSSISFESTLFLQQVLCFLCRNAQILAEVLSVLENQEHAEKYRQLAVRMSESIR
jgi:hypothetical protein